MSLPRIPTVFLSDMLVWTVWVNINCKTCTIYKFRKTDKICGHRRLSFGASVTPRVLITIASSMHDPNISTVHKSNRQNEYETSSYPLHLPVYALSGFLTDILDKEGIGVVALEVNISSRLVFTDHEGGLYIS